MKKLHKWGLMAASGILSMLGFGSCTTKYVDVSSTIADKQGIIDELNRQNNNLRKEHSDLQRQINDLSNPPKVYGPPPRK